VWNPRSGLTFTETAATRADTRIAEIAEIPKPDARARELFAYLENWVPPGAQRADKDFEAALRGPILSDSLTDVTRPVERFEATTLVDHPERPFDQRHSELLATLQFAAARLAKTDTQNRIGRDIAESLREYAAFSAQEPINPRVMNYLANSVRAAISDAELAASLDAFDTGLIAGFLAENDSLIREYYPRAIDGPQYDSETNLETLVQGLFPRLGAAKDILRKADADGLFAPSVSDALEMLERRAEGAKRKLLTSSDPKEMEIAEKELRRTTVLVTAYLGRINVRLTQFVNKQVKKFGEDPVDGTLRLSGLVEIAQGVISTLKPIFDALWEMIGNLPLPF
jgi:hypothetical protein